MHQTSLKVTFVDAFPLAKVKRNNSCHFIKMSGFNANFIRFLATEMHFAMDMIPNNFTTLEGFNLFGNQSKGLTRMLETGQLNLIANLVFGAEPANIRIGVK